MFFCLTSGSLVCSLFDQLESSLILPKAFLRNTIESLIAFFFALLRNDLQFFSHSLSSFPSLSLAIRKGGFIGGWKSSGEFKKSARRKSVVAVMGDSGGVLFGIQFRPQCGKFSEAIFRSVVGRQGENDDVWYFFSTLPFYIYLPRH